jgi:uracil phosphoribosyltransferase
MRPHAKRIPFKGGLIVGLTGFQLPQPNNDRCIIVDGAIASGATLMAIIGNLRSVTSTFYIYSVHSAYEGLRAILRYGQSIGVDIQITVGHATVGINKKFYAIDANNPKRVVVGDLGDTIS